MLCKIPGCQHQRMFVKGSGPTYWTEPGDKHSSTKWSLEKGGAPVTNPKPIDLCYFHHKKSLGLFDTEPEDYRKGGKYYAQDKGSRI